MSNRLSEWFLGNAWMYNWIRPFVLGGFDFSEAYQWLDTNPSDVIVDVGCGFGEALRYLPSFQAYHGFDTSERAIGHFRQKHGGDSRIHLHQGEMTWENLQRIKPTKVLLMGILHHLDRSQALQLLGWMRSQPTLQRIVTQDPLYQSGKWINNLLCWLDRGRYVLDQAGYEQLVRDSGLEIQHRIHCSSGNRLAHYLCLGLST
ncbi:class I SAM-dependent methyltransferase [bacterium]|nr:class I SAM-dependent methyltransferase [bacterium]